jgi:hypothetical protein
MNKNTPDLDKRLVFLYQQDLIVTGNFSNVVVNLKWYRSQLDLIDDLLGHVENYLKTPRAIHAGRYINWHEIVYLHAVWDQLNLELTDMEKLLPQTRQKRGLINFRGEVLNFLFGTATSAEIQTLH